MAITSGIAGQVGPLERPDPENIPDFALNYSTRHAFLATALIRGRRILEIGPGLTGIREYLGKLRGDYYYLGVDKAIEEEQGPNWQLVKREFFEGYDWLRTLPRFSTVVALEVIEHIDPARQFEFLQKLSELALERIILSTPSPDTKRWYPRTDILVGNDNPFHLRELDEWKLRLYASKACKVRQVTILSGSLTSDDEVIWLGDLNPPAVYLGVIDLA